MAGSLHCSCLCNKCFQAIEQTHPGNPIYKQDLLRLVDFACVHIKYSIFYLQNHLAERHWVEINSRVNFPIKRALVSMQTNSVIDMDCPTTKYCVSFMTSKLCQIGIQKHIQAWNNHRIPGRDDNECLHDSIIIWCVCV